MQLAKHKTKSVYKHGYFFFFRESNEWGCTQFISIQFHSRKFKKQHCVKKSNAASQRRVLSEKKKKKPYRVCMIFKLVNPSFASNNAKCVQY